LYGTQLIILTKADADDDLENVTTLLHC